MTLEQRVEALDFNVEFPGKNGLSLTKREGLAMECKQRIGSNVSVKIGKENVATIQYNEDLTPEFTLEGYNRRAQEHAQNVIAKIIEAAPNQAALINDGENRASPIFRGVITASQ